MTEPIVENEPWPLRAVLLLALGGFLGVVFQEILDQRGGWSDDPLRLAAASFIAVGGIVFAFTLERRRWTWSIAFALLCGMVVAAVFHWNGSPQGWVAGDGWRVFSALLAVVIAAPLFMAARDSRPAPIAYPAVFDHAWTNLVLWFAAGAFVFICWLLAQLLAELFRLIGIDFLKELLDRRWFNWLLAGAALGAAIGLLRDRDRVLNLLQGVVTAILSFLAPILAAGLLLFVLALPFTGLQPLWDQTANTTPIVLGCAIAALILSNATIGGSAEREAKPAALLYAALVLAAVTLPLALVAAISTGKRIAQYGFTPERLWGLVFVIVATAVGLAYLVAVLRGRRLWRERLRIANLRLAIGLCLLALLLATPLLNFGAISTRDQLARLSSGRVSARQFDWAALRFDFGPSGRRALQGLSASGPAETRQSARQALTYRNRWQLAEANRLGSRGDELGAGIKVLPQPAPLPEPLRQAVAQRNVCGFAHCTLFWRPGESEAIAVGFPCETCPAHVSRLVLVEGRWSETPFGVAPGDATPDPRKLAVGQRQAMAQGQVEIRPVPMRQVHVGGKPVGGAFR